jgi:ERCC4-type nuclease
MERSTSSSSFSSRATTPNECGTPLNSQTLIQSSGIICIDLSENEEEQEQELLREKQRVGTRVDGKRHENDLICDSDEWELVLLLDHREILSRRNRSILERKLVEKNITCQVRALSVGDMLWIVKRYRPCVQLDGSTTLEVKEFVLNVIVERKEVKDLSGSIVDKR